MSPNHPPLAHTGAPHGPAVLVVDDDAAILDFVRAALEDTGYRVYTAVGGEALPVARDRQPALILLDIQMPGMDGIEVSRRLRADPATAPIPIVAMSAQERLLAAGARLQVNDRQPKPFDLADLYLIVARWTARPER